MVYHNPNFLHYRGDHSQIVPQTQPVATVTAPDGLPLNALLDVGYAKTQHAHGSWFSNPQVLVHLRSTSVGDLITDGDGNLYVVESFGFQPYQPKVVTPVHRLAEAYRLWITGVDGADTRSLLALVRRALAAIQHVLAAEGYPASESPILWEKAQPGDLVGSPEVGQFRVIARKLRPKWRAKRLLAHIPDAQIWIDSPHTWAVLVPINEEVQS
jgi:hypothetical protein